MKYSKVTESGKYVKPPLDRLSYGTMVYVRVGIVMSGYKKLAQAVTIAVRYSAVRRQVKKSYFLPTIIKGIFGVTKGRTKSFGLQATTV